MTDGKKDTRYYTMDFWRGVACLLVLVYHSCKYYLENPVYANPQGLSRGVFMFLDHSWVGVPMFFVISGYCITAACENARVKGFNAWNYVKRRFRRIYPPYWAAMLLSAVFLATFTLLGAGYLLYDDSAHTFDHVRLDYDVLAAMTRIREAGLPGYLADRLASGE